MRTPSECEQIAAERLDALTSMLDLRPIAGDAAARGRGRRPGPVLAAADVAGFARALREDAAARAEHGSASTAYLLEPDLKQGAGGLRDVQAVRWVTRVAGDALLRTAEREALDDAEEFLTRVRSALQLETGKRADRLPLELQAPIARAMGFTDEPRLIAEDGLMRAVFEHARAVRWIAANVLARAEADRRCPPRTPSPFDDADEALEALAAVGGVAASDSDRRAARLGRRDRGARAGRRGPIGPSRRSCASCEPGKPASPPSTRSTALGLLARLLPAWADVRCRPQRDPYHRFTVDTHLTTALVEMGRLLDGADDDDPLIAGARSHGPDRDGLLLGALLHDIGKTGEGGHVPAGSRIAGEALDRMGVRGPDA